MSQEASAKVGSCVVAGHICLDVIPTILGQADFETTFKPGRLIETGPVVMATGGAVANTGQALHKLGIDTRLIGKIGDDTFGQAILDIVGRSSAHLAEGMRLSPGEASSYTIILSPPHTDRLFLHCPGPNNTFGAADIDFDLVAQVDLFHFGYPTIMERMYQNNGAELLEVFQQAKATGATTSLDLALPDPNSSSGRSDWRGIFKAVLPEVDLFVPSLEETLFTLRPQTFATFTQGQQPLTADLLSSLADELLAMGVKIVLLKAGEGGLYLRTADESKLVTMGRAQPDEVARWANRELWAPIFVVNMAGTTGAGDAAIAGFLAALLRGYSPTEAITLAAAVGACNVEAPDALSGVQGWAETLTRIEAGWPRRPIAVETPGWRFDETKQIWLGPNDASL